MPSERNPRKPKNAPRTDLPPTREPYYDGYFGTGEETAVERERQAPDPGEELERKDRPPA